MSMSKCLRSIQRHQRACLQVFQRQSAMHPRGRNPMWQESGRRGTRYNVQGGIIVQRSLQSQRADDRTPFLPSGGSQQERCPQDQRRQEPWSRSCSSRRKDSAERRSPSSNRRSESSLSISSSIERTTDARAPSESFLMSLMTCHSLVDRGPDDDGSGRSRTFFSSPDIWPLARDGRGAPASALE